MNKQIIRLTEADLHQMVKEAVNEALNELDPRTYASYAQKRQAQADAMPNGWDKTKAQWKANDGRYAATNAWNKQYGQNSTSYNGFGDISSHQSYMQNDEYNVHDNDATIGADGSRSYITRNYDPSKNQVSYDHQRYNMDGRNTFNQQGQQEGGYQYGDGKYVARQMAQGNGQYIKGQGWK